MGAKACFHLRLSGKRLFQEPPSSLPPTAHRLYVGYSATPKEVRNAHLLFPASAEAREKGGKDNDCWNCFLDKSFV